MLLLISIAVDGDNDWAASLMILGPMLSSPVDFEASKVLICNKTCSGVINGIVNCVFVGTLLSTKSLILLVSKSNELPDDVFSFKSSATEAKYLFSLLATASDSVMVSSSIISFSGKLLEAVLSPLFTSRRCFHKDFGIFWICYAIRKIFTFWLVFSVVVWLIFSRFHICRRGIDNLFKWFCTIEQW